MDLAEAFERGTKAAEEWATSIRSPAMWTRLFKRLETLFVAVTFAEAGEPEIAREIAYGKH